MDIWSPSLGAPSVSSAGPDCSRVVDRERTHSPYQQSGDEGSSVSLDHLQGPDHGRVHFHDEPQCHHDCNQNKF